MFPKKKLYPFPKQYQLTGGSLTLPDRPVLFFRTGSDDAMRKLILRFCDHVRERAGIRIYPVADYEGKLNISIRFSADHALTGEAYRIRIDADGICVFYGEPVAAFRAQETLCQLLEIHGTALPCLEIEDWPDLERRGFMLDISRGKVPKLEKLFRLVDWLARIKINELQLYLEQFAVEYPAFPEYADRVDALTPEDLTRLTLYCKENYVDLVPNQNSFGHLAKWLAEPALAELGVQKSGNSFSLNPLDPNSLTFVTSLFDSLLPCFDSDRIHIGFDEVSGLTGDGSKVGEVSKEIGWGQVYIDYLLKVNDVIRERGKRAQFWGDILLDSRNKELVPQIPKDMIPMIWGYCGTATFENDAALMESLGYDFYICPGTSSWPSVFPDIQNSNGNVLDAAQCAVRHHAKGLLMTEWGDYGHIQPDFAMQLGLVYAGGVSWNLEANSDFEDVCDFADGFLYRSGNYRVSEFIRRGGAIYDENYFWTIVHRKPDDNKGIPNFEYDHYLSLKLAMTELAKDARKMDAGCEDGELIKSEIICAAKLYAILSEYMMYRVQFAELGKDIPDFETNFKSFMARYEDLKVAYKRNWNARNLERENNLMFSWLDTAFQRLSDAVTAPEPENAG